MSSEHGNNGNRRLAAFYHGACFWKDSQDSCGLSAFPVGVSRKTDFDREVGRGKYDAFVGLCGFLSDSSVPNFIYSIAEDKKGRGYACEASKAAIEAGRRTLGSDLVELNIHSENKNSIRVAKKLGFTKTSEYEDRYPQLSGPGMVQVFRRAYT